MLPAPESGPTPGFIALLRFRSSDVPSLMVMLREAIALLSSMPGFVDARVSRAIDDAALITVAIGWDAVGSYRRALSAYDVKVQVVPLLSQALDEPTAFEVLHQRDGEGTADAPGALAADASSVRLGSASAQIVPPAPS